MKRSLNKGTVAFIKVARKVLGDVNTITTEQMEQISKSNNMTFPHYLYRKNCGGIKLSKNLYVLPKEDGTIDDSLLKDVSISVEETQQKKPVKEKKVNSEKRDATEEKARARANLRKIKIGYDDTEPQFEGMKEDCLAPEIKKVWSWYRCYSNEKQMVRYMNFFLQEEEVDETISMKVKDCLDRITDVDWAPCFCARAYENLKAAGLEKTKYAKEFFDVIRRGINRFCNDYDNRHPKKKRETSGDKKQITIQDRLNSKADLLMTEIDHQIDLFLKMKKGFPKFSLIEYLNKNDAKGVIATKIANKIRDYYLKEIVEMLESKNEQLVEGYGFLSDRRIKNFVEWLEGLLKEAEMFGKTSNLQRKPRKKKIKTAEEQIKKVQCKTEDKEYGIVSISPTKIVGASEVWLFNTLSNQKQLIHLQAADARGFSIKGTTIKNVDTDKENTYFYRLRKPKEVLSVIVNGGKVEIRNIIKKLTTKRMKATGRLNKHIVILRVTR